LHPDVVVEVPSRATRAGQAEAAPVCWSWRQKFTDVSEQVRADRGETPEDELKRLRRENMKLKKEREILVKAAAFLAKETS
jgi:transposase-like protein